MNKIRDERKDFDTAHWERHENKEGGLERLLVEDFISTAEKSQYLGWKIHLILLILK